MGDVFHTTSHQSSFTHCKHMRASLDTAVQTQYEAVEAMFGNMMKKLAEAEGHKARLPPSEMKYHVPPPSRIKKDVMAYLQNSSGPVTTKDLLTNISDAQAPNLRRVCRDLEKVGFIRTERTKEGCLYTFVGDL
jgi:hypothetical protein